MSTFILVPGAGGMASYWSLVAPRLIEAGHAAIAVDLPGDSETDGLPEYCNLVLEAIGARTDIVVVASSLAGFTAAMVCARKPPPRLVFVNAMIPEPGETPGAWWGNTGAVEARIEAAKERGYTADFDLPTYFLHDVPPEVLKTSPPPRGEGKLVFGQPCAFEQWPADLVMKVIAGTDDRFFPFDFQARVARARLNLPVKGIRGGHLVALSNPEELAAELIAD